MNSLNNKNNHNDNYNNDNEIKDLNTLEIKINQIIKFANLNFFSSIRILSEDEYHREEIPYEKELNLNKKMNLASDLEMINKFISLNNFLINNKCSKLRENEECSKNNKNYDLDDLIVSINESLENDKLEKLPKYSSGIIYNFKSPKIEIEERSSSDFSMQNKKVYEDVNNLNEVYTRNKLNEEEEEEEFNFDNLKQKNFHNKNFSLMQINSNIKNIGKGNFSPTNDYNRNSNKSFSQYNLHKKNVISEPSPFKRGDKIYFTSKDFKPDKKSTL